MVTMAAINEARKALEMAREDFHRQLDASTASAIRDAEAYVEKLLRAWEIQGGKEIEPVSTAVEARLHTAIARVKEVEAAMQSAVDRCRTYLGARGFAPPSPGQDWIERTIEVLHAHVEERNRFEERLRKVANSESTMFATRAWVEEKIYAAIKLYATDPTATFVGHTRTK
jgi:uncharacterized protein YqgV (UPF0045/DUF77 family)